MNSDIYIIIRTRKCVGLLRGKVRNGCGAQRVSHQTDLERERQREREREREREKRDERKKERERRQTTRENTQSLSLALCASLSLFLSLVVWRLSRSLSLSLPLSLLSLIHFCITSNHIISSNFQFQTLIDTFKVIPSHKSFWIMFWKSFYIFF